MSRKGKPFWRTSAEDEVNADLAFHLDMTTRELMEQGMPESQARAEAERRFGNINVVHAECRGFAEERDRHSRRAELRFELAQDARFALRQLARARGFTAIAVLTLALGFGATAAVYSALYAVVLRPLPFDHPERVVTLQNSRKGELSGGASAPDFLALRDQTRGAFDHVAAAVLGSGFTIRTGDTPELVPGGRVSSSYFAVFGVRPALGRVFTADEDAPGRDNVVVLSHRAWTNRFNQDRAVIGRVIQVDASPRTIVGVMPAAFDLTRDAEELWVPLALTPEQATKNALFLRLFGRMKAGVSMEQAEGAATAAKRAAIADAPDRRDPVTDYAIELRPFVDNFVGDYKGLLLILLGAVGFVLLIACTNVANLLIARGSTRARELSIRAALGAGRARLVRQLLTESLLLAVAGALVGLAMAYVLLRGVVALSPDDVPRLDQARVDGNVLAFTLAIAVASTVIFGLVPAFRAVGKRLEATLREGGRSIRGGRDRLRATLVGAEVALAMTLLVGAGLLIRSAWLVQQVQPGFDPRAVLTSRLMLPAARYPDPGAITSFYQRLYERANQTPGIRSAALVSVVPLSGSSMSASVFRDGQSRDEGRPLPANLRLASPRYFETMRIPIVAGRDIDAHDDASVPAVVVINEALAARLWPNTAARDLLGKRIDALSRARSEPHWMEVVGVVGNLKDASLSQPASPEFFVPVAQTPVMLWPLIQRSLVLTMRGSNDDVPAETLTKQLRAAVDEVDAGIPVADVRSMTAFVRGSQATARFNTLLLSILGAIALALAVIGVYGVVAYFVSQRTQEIALRMALGATPLNIWQFVVNRGLRPLLIGLAAGSVLAAVAARVLESQLYDVSSTDPLTFAATAMLLLGVSLLATYAPARRAIRVTPVVALAE